MTVIIQEDNRLEEAEGEATRALMEHRWHWTLDESNPERKSMYAYAQAKGRSIQTIREYAKGFELLRKTPGMTPQEARHRAGMSAEREMAVEAVAQAQGVTFVKASTANVPEIRYTHAAAQDAAIQNNTSFEEEVKKAANRAVGGRRIKEEQEERQFTAPLAGLRTTIHSLVGARDKLREAHRDAQRVQWTLEEAAASQGLVDECQSLLAQIENTLAKVVIPTQGPNIRAIK